MWLASVSRALSQSAGAVSGGLLRSLPGVPGEAVGSEGLAGFSVLFRRWASKKQGGSTQNGRDSQPKNLGVKKFGGEHVIAGNIIVRQRGRKFHPGENVGIGVDHTLYAKCEGNVKFTTDYSNPHKKRRYINVVAFPGAEALGQVVRRRNFGHHK